MTTSTFKSVGGTSKPADQAAAKSAKGRAVPAPKAAKKPAAAKPVRKPGTITIEGTGTIPIHADGAMRRLPRGEPVEVSEAELAFIEHAGIKFA